MAQIDKKVPYKNVFAPEGITQPGYLHHVPVTKGQPLCHISVFAHTNSGCVSFYFIFRAQSENLLY